MKKLLSVILTVALIAGCFAACNSQPPKGDSAATPTAVEPTKEQVEDVVAVPDEEEQETENKQQAEENQEPQESVVDNKPVTEKKPQKQDNPVASKAEKKDFEEQTETTWTAEEIHGDIAQNNPTFVSEEALQIWLQQGSGAYETQRTEYLALSKKNNAINYFWPSDELTKLIPFKKLEIHSTNHKYSFFYQESLVVAANIDKSTSTYKSFEELYNSCKARYDEGHKNYGLIKDKNSAIEFYYYISDLNCTFIYWEQYGFVHTAQLFDQSVPLEKLISLLKLEQVTINLNSDHVTQ